MRKPRPRNGKGLAQSHMIRPRELGWAQAPGLAGNHHGNSQAGMEELLGLASLLSMRDHGGHMAPVHAEWPGPPGSDHSGGHSVEPEAGSPDLVASHHPGCR